MMPGMNPKMMKQAMKKMGMQQEDIDAVEVIIRCPDKELVVTDPTVAKVKAMGTEQITVSGEITERELSTGPEISEEDIKTVVEQTGASEEEAEKALEELEGDIAAAILNLKSE